MKPEGAFIGFQSLLAAILQLSKVHHKLKKDTTYNMNRISLKSVSLNAYTPPAFSWFLACP